MTHIFIDGLPGLADSIGTLSLRTRALWAVINSPRFIARLSLDSSQVAWLHERLPVRCHDSTWKLPRRISISGSNLWCSEADEVVAELSPTEDGGALVSGRHAATGRLLWEQNVPIPEAAEWAELSPAWPGAPTEEIDAFFASDPNRLVVCMSRQSRRSRMYSSAITIDTLPPYACQLDATRLDLSTGAPLWTESFRDVVIGILARRAFSGIWSRDQRVGALNFETGTSCVLHEQPHTLGWPIHDGSHVAVPWHSKGEVGILWLDERGDLKRHARWQQPRVSATTLHNTDAGLALQVNDGMLCWLGKEDVPLWTIHAKPYIYRVHASLSTDVFVGTDGHGGRLFAFDRVSGKETLNLKPPVGGAGTLAKVPAHEVLVAKFWCSRKDTVAGNLFTLSMRDRSHRLDWQCRELVGTWQHGAVCVAGKYGERLAVVDIR